jgi:cell division septum initiation protein DivIVA
MSDPTTPGTGDFTLSRKGYDVDQVEQALAQLTASRDEAWQRLAALGDEMRGLERELMDIQAAQVVAEAVVPDFEVLSPRAAGLLVTAEEEAEAVRLAAVEESARLDGQARTDARRVRANAGQYADQVRAACDESQRRELERARSQAEALREEADRDVRTAQEEAAAYADEVRVRAEQASSEAHAWLAGQQRTVEQEFEAHDTKVVAWEDQVLAIGERKVSESERHLKAMRAKSDEIDADASNQAERLIEAAKREAARIAEQSEREEATFAERREHIQAQLDHIRETLVALTGSVATTPESEPAEAQSAEADAEPEVDTEAKTSELSALPQAVENNPESR